jgi:hypothetical protein
MTEKNNRKCNLKDKKTTQDSLHFTSSKKSFSLCDGIDLIAKTILSNLSTLSFSSLNTTFNIRQSMRNDLILSNKLHMSNKFPLLYFYYI